MNAPREVVNKIARQGLAGLTPEERSRVAETFDSTNQEHRKYVLEEYERHVKGSIKDFETFYEAQLAWEETMAETLVQALKAVAGNDPGGGFDRERPYLGGKGGAP